MIISIDGCSTEPLYKQIHDQVIAGIATGELEPGMSLPSVRSLASDLGINLHTVNKASAVLRDEGYVQMRGRAGAVIGYPLMPERFATNIDLSGQVSRWVEKTPLTAAFPALTVMFLDACFAFSHWSILRSKKGIDAARPAVSA